MPLEQWEQGGQGTARGPVPRVNMETRKPRKQEEEEHALNRKDPSLGLNRRGLRTCSPSSLTHLSTLFHND